MAEKPKIGNVVRSFSIGNTRVKICDDCCRDRTPTEVSAILKRIARNAQLAITAAATETPRRRLKCRWMAFPYPFKYTIRPPNKQDKRVREGGENVAIRYKPKNEFGQEVDAFRAATGMPIKELAEAADVKYTTLIECTTGRTPGHELIPKVRETMARLRAELDPTG